MTPTTIRDAGLLKLPAMHILMTSYAILACSGKTTFGILRISGMTSRTIRTQVGAFQLERCNGMIKLSHFFPFGSGMAYGAVLIGVIRSSNTPFVYVRVAVHAFCADVSKPPPVFVFQMAGKTRCCGVRSGERKGGAGMLLYCKVGELKTVGSVASSAIGRSVVDDKLALMIVGMTGRTSVVGKRVGKTV